MFCMESSCQNCVYKSMSPDGPYCRRGHKYHDFTLCSEWKEHPKPHLDIQANIPEEDQIKRKDDPIDQDPIDRAAEQICDDYCKFPELIKNLDILHRICEECPLNILMKG